MAVHEDTHAEPHRWASNRARQWLRRKLRSRREIDDEHAFYHAKSIQQFAELLVLRVWQVRITRRHACEGEQVDIGESLIKFLRAMVLPLFEGHDSWNSVLQGSERRGDLAYLRSVAVDLNLKTTTCRTLEPVCCSVAAAANTEDTPNIIDTTIATVLMNPP